MQALVTGVNNLEQGVVYALPGFPCQILSSRALSLAPFITYGPTSWVEPGMFVDGGSIKSPDGNDIIILKKHTIGKSGAATSYEASVIMDRPSYYWRLNDTGSLAQERMQGLNGTISGGVTLNQPGALVDGDKCMVFDGVSGKIVTSANVTVPVPLTFEFWLKSIVSGTMPAVGSQYPATATSDAIICLPLPGGLQIQVYHSPDSVPGAISCGGVNVLDGQWHHLVFICLGGVTGSIFVDGVAKGIVGTFTRPLVGISSKSIEIGFSNAFGVYYNGAIDEVAIYPYALSPAQIAQHYKARSSPFVADSYASKVIASGPSNYWRLGETYGLTFVDCIGGKNAVSPNSTGITYGVSSALTDGSTGLTFNSTQAPAIAPSIVVGTTCTFEFWFKTGNTTPGYHGMLTGAVDGLYNMPSSGGKINLFFAGADHLNVTTLPLNVMYHFVISITDGNGIFYINGVADGTFSGWPGATFTNLFAAPANFPYNGFLDEVAIYPRALTAAEILSHFQAR